jgi:hypothetical protein
MNAASESFRALRRANPRGAAGFAEAVESAGGAIAGRLAETPRPTPRSRSRLLPAALVAAIAGTAAIVAFSTISSPGGGPGVVDAQAAVRKAATLTAASAERSGTAVVRITHDGRLWAGTTVRWNGKDLSVARDAPDRAGKAGSGLLVVAGLMYGRDPRTGGWVVLGPPESVDPDSGTTPDEYLAAAREDVGGATLLRLTGRIQGLTAVRDGGSTVYRGTIAAGQIARETGFKEGEAIRVLPFGYVAHDEAADPSSPLDVAITVGADDVVRKLAVTWGTWSYTVTYDGLGATPAPTAPADAKPLDRGPAGVWGAPPGRSAD